MHLTPKESERLDLFLLAELARRRFRNKVKLNYIEAIAIISDELLEHARFGEKNVTEVISFGKKILTREDVLPGVEELLSVIQVEGLFNSETKLITVHNPIVYSTRSELTDIAYITF